MTQEDQAGSKRITVLIAHEVRLVRDGLASLLLKSPELAVVELPLEENKLKEKQKGDTVDIVLAVAWSDINDAPSRIRKIKYAFPDAKIVVIAISETENECLEYIEAGASGYVLSGSRPEDLIETIQKVHRGEVSCPPDVLARLFERIVSLRAQIEITKDSQLSSLTQRELEVLHLVADGMSNKEISVRLGVELQTVKNHVHNILEKLRVSNRREAVALSRKLGLAVEIN
jgi:two-component system nitrate/nitrite response regulator NarL